MGPATAAGPLFFISPLRNYLVLAVLAALMLAIGVAILERHHKPSHNAVQMRRPGIVLKPDRSCIRANEYGSRYPVVSSWTVYRGRRNVIRPFLRQLTPRSPGDDCAPVTNDTSRRLSKPRTTFAPGNRRDFLPHAVTLLSPICCQSAGRLPNSADRSKPAGQPVAQNLETMKVAS